MPINVQPSIVTDPAAVIQRSAQVQNEAAAQAFRNAQVGQQSGQAGMDTAIKSTAALAEQRARENEQKRAAIQQNFQQAASTMTQLGRDWRKEKLDLSKEQRALDRQTEEQKMNEFPTALAAISDARIKATDENGNIDPEYAAKLDASEKQLRDAYSGNIRSKHTAAIAEIAPVYQLAGQQAARIAKEKGDVLQRDIVSIREEHGLYEQKQALNASFLKTTLGLLDSTLSNKAERLESFSAGLEGDIKYRAQQVAPIIMSDLHPALDEHGRKYANAMAVGDLDMMNSLVDSGKVTRGQVTLISQYKDSLFRARAEEGVTVSRFGELTERMPSDLIAATRESFGPGAMHMERQLMTHPNLTNAGLITGDMRMMAYNISRDTNGAVSEEDVLNWLVAAARRNQRPIVAPPNQGYTAPAPTASPAVPFAPGAPAPRPAARDDGIEGPPAPTLDDRSKEALNRWNVYTDPRSTKAERRAAGDAIQQEAMAQLGFANLLGDKGDADLLAKTAAAIPGIREEAEGFGIEHRAEAGKAWAHPFDTENEKYYWPWSSGKESATRAAIGEEFGRLSDDEVSAATRAAAAVKAGKITEKEGQKKVADFAKGMAKLYRRQAEESKEKIRDRVKKNQLDADRAKQLIAKLDKRTKKATQNSLTLYRELTTDSVLSARLIPEELIEAFRSAPKSGLKVREEIGNEDTFIGG